MNRFAGIFFQIPQIWLTQPAADATTEDRTPDLIAAYGGFLSGTISFEIDKVSTFNSPLFQSGSALGLTDGDSGTWTPTSLTNGDWFWRARGTNEAGDSDWTATRKLTVQAGVSIRTLYQIENVAKYGPDWTKKRILYQIENVAKWGPDWTKTRAHYQYENITDDPPFPYIAYLSTTQASQGGAVTIYGNGFGAKAASDPDNPDRAARGYGGYVYINEQICGIISWAWQQITFIVPDDAVSGPVKVRLTTPDPPGVRDSNVIGLEIVASAPTPDIGLEFYVCNKNNPLEVYALLDGATDKSFQTILNGVGSGRFRISRQDPKGGNRTYISNENYVSCKIDGVEYFKWIIENKQPIYVGEGDASAEWIECSGRGVLSILERGVVYPEGMPTPSSLERSWSGVHAAAILKTLIEEAQARGTLSVIDIDFTATADSIGNPWDDLTDISFHTGTPLLDVAQKFSDSMGIFDLEMTPTLKLKAYKNQKGVDRSATIRYHEGQGLLDYSDASVTDKIKNIVLVEGEAGGIVEVVHSTSPTTWGRRESYLQARNIPDDYTQLQNYGNAMLATTAAAQWSILTSVDWWPFKPFENYQLGDWVWVTIIPIGTDTLGIDQRMRVKGFTVEENNETGHLTCAIDLNHIRMERQMKILKQIERLAMYSDFESGLSSPSEKPPAPLVHNHDHGTLLGLEDDDHDHYYNEARHTADPHTSVPRVSSLKKTGGTSLTGDVTLAAGANVTLTQDDGLKKITIAASGGGGGGWKDPVANISGTPTEYDDEFNDDSLSAAWTTVIPSGSLVLTEKYDVLSALVYDTSSNQVAALLKSMGSLTAPVTIECAVRMFGLMSNYFMCGPVFSDGVLATSNAVFQMPYILNGDPTFSLRSGTLSIISAITHFNLVANRSSVYGWLFMRLTWVSANTWLAQWSPDGVTWTDFDQGNKTANITPTHFGIGFSAWGGGASKKIATVEYFRVS